MKIPKRGNIYSCNEANAEGWDDQFKEYTKVLKTGKGQTGQRYTQRYECVPFVLMTISYLLQVSHKSIFIPFNFLGTLDH